MCIRDSQCRSWRNPFFYYFAEMTLFANFFGHKSISVCRLSLWHCPRKIHYYIIAAKRINRRFSLLYYLVFYVFSGRGPTVSLHCFGIMWSHSSRGKECVLFTERDNLVQPKLMTIRSSKKREVMLSSMYTSKRGNLVNTVKIGLGDPTKVMAPGNRCWAPRKFCFLLINLRWLNRDYVFSQCQTEVF